jgi:hypothetical protein
MRTTLDIDDDVLQAAKEIAASCGTTAGKVISDLVRKGMTPDETYEVFNGIRLMPRRPAGSRMPTMELVNRLRDDDDDPEEPGNE